MYPKPLFLHEVDQDRRLVHLLNRDLAVPLLKWHGLKLKNLKAHLLPLVDSRPDYRLGRHFYVPFSSRLEAAFCYNHNFNGIDSVDVFAVSRLVLSVALRLWRRLMSAFLTLHDHALRRPEPEIKHGSVYDDFIYKLHRLLMDIEIYIDQFGSEQAKSDIVKLLSYFDNNVEFDDDSLVTYPNLVIFDNVLKMSHRILLQIYPR